MKNNKTTKPDWRALKAKVRRMKRLAQRGRALEHEAYELSNELDELVPIANVKRGERDYWGDSLANQDDLDEWLKAALTLVDAQRNDKNIRVKLEGIPTCLARFAPPLKKEEE